MAIRFIWRMYNMKARRLRLHFSICFVALLAAWCGLAQATTYTWTGAGGNDWFTDGNWDQSGFPGDNDAVAIGSGTPLLTNSTASLASLTISGGTLTCSNWATKITATDVLITNSGAKITLPVAFTDSEMSNRVWIACSNITIAAGATIDVDGKGWSGKKYGAGPEKGFGPGAPISGSYNGASYGGYGREDNHVLNRGLIYGSESEPFDPGSGGSGYTGNYNGGNGGGAVRIEATGDVIVNGKITANAGDPYSNGGGGGSGGGIYISCNKIEGSGIVMANGSTSIGNSKSGGGGRIAVAYNSAAQSAITVPVISFFCSSPSGSSSGAGDIGTLYFTDNRFLERSPLTGITGQWHSASANLNFAQLAVSNARIRFANDSLILTVTNELLLTANAIVEIGGNVTYSNFWWDYQAAAALGGKLPRPVTEMTSNPKLECGSITLTNGGALWVFAGLTNGAIQTGALVKVSQMLTISTNSWLYPVSHGMNGGQVALVAGGVNLMCGGGIDANGLGYGLPDNTYATANGYGPGGGWYNDSKGVGGGYGGQGGNAQSTYGQTYGSSNVAPFSCGSGGGAWSSGGIGGSGGGFVFIDAASGDVTINGAIKADGGPAGNHQCGAGSGGGIHIVCQNFAGSGRIQAVGGTKASGLTGVGGGGGGRIAIFRPPASDTFTGVGEYSVLPGEGVAYIGAVGTIYLQSGGPFLEVKCSGATDITDWSAALNGEVVSTNGPAPEVWVYWGSTDGGMNQSAWAHGVDLGTKTGAFAAQVTGLLATNTYYYRCWVSNSVGTAWSGSGTNFMTDHLRGPVFRVH